MSRLKMITQSDPKPRDVGGVQMKTLPRVYFAAHPNGYKGYLDAISKDIFRTHNCAFCYDTQPEVPYDELILQDLGNMNLFVVPITRQLLTDPVSRRVLEIDLPFAVEHNIPILPLMQEGDLQSRYDKVAQLKSMQALNKHFNDTTALSYEDKLKSFLDSVLLDDALIRQIQKAFSARIFLSYRKKDRAFARELMHLLHQDPALRDVAIWYDEFLTFGENFNEEIAHTIGKSQIFLLAVTPNLMEAGNYVIKYEYPAALAEGKPVLPVQMTTKEPVRRAFSQVFLKSDDKELCAKIKKWVKKMVNAADADSVCSAVKESLKEVFEKTPTENNTPQQEYLMGVAYLNGLELEVDQERAVALLQRSANGGFPAAMIELMRMYTTGHGVPRDLESALYWHNRLVDWYQHEYRRTQNKDFLEASLRIQEAMVRTLYDINDSTHLEAADRLCAQLSADYRTLHTPEENPARFAELYQKWSTVLFDLGEQHHARAIELLNESLRWEKQVYLATDTPHSARHALLQRYSIGAVCCMKHHHDAIALNLLQQGQDLYGNEWDTEDDADFIRTKSTILGYRGILRKNLPDLLWAFSMQQRLHEHKGDSKPLYWLSAVSLNIAELVFKEGPDPDKRFERIYKYLQTAEQYAYEWHQQQESSASLEHLCLVLCSQIRLYYGMSHRAEQPMQAAYEKLEKDVMPYASNLQAHLPLAYWALGQKRETLGDAAFKKGLLGRAKNHYADAETDYQNGLSAHMRKPAKNLPQISNRSELYGCLGRIYAKQEKYERAWEQFAQSRQLLEEYATPFRASAEAWRAFLITEQGLTMMKSYADLYRDEVDRWVAHYERKCYDVTLRDRTKELLHQGLNLVEEWKTLAPGPMAYWSSIELRMLQERLSWATEEYALAYQCNEEILHDCALLGKSDQGFDRYFVELRAECSMGRLSIHIKQLLGQGTKTPAHVHFRRGEQLAKGLLRVADTPAVRTQLYTCQFFGAGFTPDAKKRRKIMEQLLKDVRKLHDQSPSDETQHLLAKILGAINQK